MPPDPPGRRYLLVRGTGVGGEIIRVSGSAVLVEAMRAGMSPQEGARFEYAVGWRGGAELHPAKEIGPEGP